MKALVLTVLMILGVCTVAPSMPAAALDAPAEALQVCVGTEGHTIDPAYLSGGENADYLRHLYEGLMKQVPVSPHAPMSEMRLTYGLAESVELSADGLTYRFTLREDALWSDGVPVTAGDFVYAWERLLASDTHGGAQLAAVLDTVTAESDSVLTAVLKAPCPWFLKLCGEVYTAPVRRDLVETYGGDWTDAAHIAVSGAYTIESWVHDDHIRLRKNPCYYAAETLSAETIIWYFADTEDRVSADFVSAVPDAAATGRVEQAGVYYLYLNANAIRDWRLRAAMLLSVDREALAADLGGGAAAAEGLVPEGVSLSDGTAYHTDTPPMYRWLQESFPAYDLSVYEDRCALALELYNRAVASGNWSHGRTLRFRCNEDAVNDLVAAHCCADWLRVLGLTVTVEPMTDEAYGKLLTTNTFDVACLRWMGDYDDPLSFLEIMERGGSVNFSAWGDVRYDALLEQAAVGDEGRDALLFETDCALFAAERFAVCPLYACGETYYAADGITGLAHSAHGGYWFGNAVKKTGA